MDIERRISLIGFAMREVSSLTKALGGVYIEGIARSERPAPIAFLGDTGPGGLNEGLVGDVVRDCSAVFRLVVLMADAGRDGGPMTVSLLKMLDLRRLGDGEGGS